ncbi:MAG: hypothetical protein LBT21_00515 [Oscillospiraceae bacterium]|nr:hypothetical protein [Oscillospiraceae bacterium]
MVPKALTKILIALTLPTFIFSAFMSATSAWRTNDQHKTNEAIGGVPYTQAARPATNATRPATSRAEVTTPAQTASSTATPATTPVGTAPHTTAAPHTTPAQTTAMPATTVPPATPAPSAPTTIRTTAAPGSPPKTGDSSDALPWFALMIFSAFSMRYLLFGRKEHELY